MTIEIRDCFNKEGVTIYFSFDDIARILSLDIEAVAELSEKLNHCKQWREDQKTIFTKQILAAKRMDDIVSKEYLRNDAGT